jgi:hypothetical protein
MSLRTRLHTLISRPIRAVLIAPLLVAGTLLTPSLAAHADPVPPPLGFVYVSPTLNLTAGQDSGTVTLAATTYDASVNVWLTPNPSINWGDGTPVDSLVFDTNSNDAGSPCTFVAFWSISCYLNDHHTYSLPGTYTITITYYTGVAISYTATTQAVVTGGAAALPFARYFAPGVGHWVTTGAVTAGYQYETVEGFLWSAQKNGTIPLYGCLAGATDHFISAQQNCEGQTFLRLEGYIYSSPVQSPPTEPLYRCYTGVDHFVSTNPTCEGQRTEGVLGYAMVYQQ